MELKGHGRDALTGVNNVKKGSSTTPSELSSMFRIQEATHHGREAAGLGSKASEMCVKRLSHMLTTGL